MPGLSSLKVNIKDQPHNLAWINDAEQDLLKDLGGSGRPGPMGIPAYDFDDFDDPEGIDDVEGFSGGADQAAEGTGEGTGDGSGGENVSPSDATFSPEDFTWSPSTGFTDPSGPTDQTLDDALALGVDWSPKEDLPYVEARNPNDPQYRTTEYTPENPFAVGLINTLATALVPGMGLARMAGFNPGKMLAGETTESYFSNKSGDRLDSSGVGPDFPENDDDGDEEVVVEEEVEEVEEETPPLTAMEQYFKDREDGATTAIDSTNDIIDRLGIQNRTIEPFNEWLAGQSEAMRAADMITQTNKYRESLRDQTSAAESYLPLVNPIRDRVTEQRFINNLYGRSAKRTSATQALFDELGI